MAWTSALKAVYSTRKRGDGSIVKGGGVGGKEGHGKKRQKNVSNSCAGLEQHASFKRPVDM